MIEQPIKLINAKFIANITIDGEYTIKQIVPFKNRLYILIERPDKNSELYYVDEKNKDTPQVKTMGEYLESTGFIRKKNNTKYNIGDIENE